MLPLAQNYDMGPSIARSDSFDVQHYELFLDVTDYAGQHLDAHATIDFTVLQDGGTRVWWDLVAALEVDSLTWNGNPAEFSRWGDELHVDAPEAMTSGDPVTLDVWYSGQPGDDPYWGGMYYASDLVYNLGIEAHPSHPLRPGVVPVFDNFVERATYTYHIKAPTADAPTTKATSWKRSNWAATRCAPPGPWTTLFPPT